MLSDVNYTTNSRRDVQSYLVDIHGTCLEIGSGNGDFAKEVLDKFPIVSYHAYEPSGKHHNDGSDPRLCVFPKYFAGSDQQYDFVFLNDVIEHMEDPLEFLHSLIVNVHANTKLYISVPNFRNIQILHKIFNGSLKYEPLGIMDKTHLRIFTRNIAADLLDKSPFRAVSISLMNKNLYIPTPSRFEMLTYKILSKILHGFIPDLFYLQILIVAQPKALINAT